MPLKLDSLDAAILRALSEDGRKSLRQLAEIIKVSAPTVNARLKRLMHSGLISRVAPIYNVNVLDKGTGALIWLKVEAPLLDDIAGNIQKFEEVKSIFLTTGEGNLLLKIFAPIYSTIQTIMDQIEAMDGVQRISTQMITKSLKDEQGVIIEPDTGVLLNCDHCKGPITGDPSALKVLDGERFFCCNTCLTAYKEKYKTKI